jgi:hypothetical protein
VSENQQYVIAPTPHILEVCSSIETVLHGFAEAFKPDPEFYRYRAHIEALMQYVSVHRTLESILALAQSDLCLVAPAMTLSRTILEGYTRTAWVLLPANPFEREARWLRTIRSMYDDFLTKSESSAREHKMPISELFSDWKSEVEGYLHVIIEANKDTSLIGMNLTDKIPDMASMMLELGQEIEYLNYRVASQYVHSSFFGTGLYRTGGISLMQQYQENIKPADWHLVFDVGWRFLYRLAHRLFEIAALSIDRWITPEATTQLETNIAAIWQLDSSSSPSSQTSVSEQ